MHKFFNYLVSYSDRISTDIRNEETDLFVRINEIIKNINVVRILDCPLENTKFILKQNCTLKLKSHTVQNLIQLYI